MFYLHHSSCWNIDLDKFLEVELLSQKTRALISIASAKLFFAKTVSVDILISKVMAIFSRWTNVLYYQTSLV